MDASEQHRRALSDAIRKMTGEDATGVNREILANLGVMAQRSCEHVNVRLDGTNLYAELEGTAYYLAKRINPAVRMGNEPRMGAWVMFIAAFDADNPTVPNIVPVQINNCFICGAPLWCYTQPHDGSPDPALNILTELMWK